ncbi:MAG: transposase [Proteobacteria bacterium]|nr:transposase [Pseudomonadota bacterium]
MWFCCLRSLILQSLYNLSDEALEFQILDRYSFSRFLGLHAASKVPDATTIWHFREDLTNAGKVAQLFSTFDEFLSSQGYRAQKGQIVDASIIKVPIQRNTRDENKQIKNGEQPEGWNENKQRQKDTDARWTRKNNKNFFGYKNHIVLTALKDEQTRLRALTHGAQDFLTKPFNRLEILTRINNTLMVRLLHNQVKNQNQVLERKVQERTLELEDTRREIIYRLGRAAEYRDQGDWRSSCSNEQDGPIVRAACVHVGE